jgi:hypothetical protein
VPRAAVLSPFVEPLEILALLPSRSKQNALRPLAGLRQAAAALRPGRIPAFELSVTNADKGCLPRAEVLARIQQFVQPDSPAVICTDAPLYVAKARLMNHTTFVIGENLSSPRPNAQRNCNPPKTDGRSEPKLALFGAVFLLRLGGEREVERIWAPALRYAAAANLLA